MNLLFTKTGDITPFVSWLELFKGDIAGDSIVIEVDAKNEKFVVKAFPVNKSIVRYSDISFKDSGFEFKNNREKDDPDITSIDDRVDIGIMKILPKFIDVLKTFATSNTFSMTVNFGYCQFKDKETGADKNCYEAESVVFKSPTLRMKIKGFQIAQFKIVSDKIFFNNVFVAPDPIEVELGPEIIKNLISISEIFKKPDNADNYMFFHTLKEDDGKHYLYINDKENSYNYKIGEAVYTDDPETDWNDIEIPILRYNFLLAVKGCGPDLKVKISSSDSTKILFTSDNGKIKTTVSHVLGVKADKE